MVHDGYVPLEKARKIIIASRTGRAVRERVNWTEY